MKSFTYTVPPDLAAALAELQAPEALLYAGGTDLTTELKDGRACPDTLVHLRATQLPELAEIREIEGGGLVLGALVTLATLTRDARIGRRYPALAAAAASAATPQLRNAGTLGGNLRQRTRCEYYRHNLPCLLLGGSECGARRGDTSHHAIFGGVACISGHPSDPAAALLALDARVRIAGSRGSRTVSLDDFYTLPEPPHYRFDVVDADELVTAVELPAPAACQGYRKAMDRATWAFALASLGYSLSLADGLIQGVRLAAAGVAPVPWRLREVEAALEGQPLGTETAQAAGAALRRAAQPFPGNAYKVDLLVGLLHELLLSLSAAA